MVGKVSTFEFEGQEIIDFTGILPKTLLECPEAYSRTTELNLNIQVRVKSVRMEEDGKGNLVRQHIFAVEAVTILDKIDPQAVLADAVSGSASSTVEPITEHEDFDCWCGAAKHLVNEPPELAPLSDEPVDFVPA